MSWWVSLNENGEPVTVSPFADGGTYVVGGSIKADLNITYNYSHHYYAHLDSKMGLRWLDGKTGAKAIKRLEKAVAALGTERSSDYWDDDPGNAGYAVSILLAWAQQYPQAIFWVS